MIGTRKYAEIPLKFQKFFKKGFILHCKCFIINDSSFFSSFMLFLLNHICPISSNANKLIRALWILNNRKTTFYTFLRMVMQRISWLQCRMNPFSKNFLFFSIKRRGALFYLIDWGRWPKVLRVLAISALTFGRLCQDFLPILSSVLAYAPYRIGRFNRAHRVIR